MKAHGLFRIGRDVELRYSPSGQAVCNLALAENIYHNKEEVTVWVDASFWGERAEKLAPHLTKGSQIMADLDNVRIETYEGKNGTGSKLVARVVDIRLAGGKKEGQQEQARQEPRQAAPRAPAPAPIARQAPAPQRSSGFDDMDDDSIPF